MPLFFPIAADARTALDAEAGARTIAEARELAGGPVTLVSEWLRPQPAESDALQGRADAGVSKGFVQQYEDAKGRPVLAVTFWKRQSASHSKTDKPAAALPQKAAIEDHTDDLYFTRAGAKAKRGRRPPDPNQLELFGKGAARANEAPDAKD